ncbi:MAG: hypothetical protein JXA50_03275 [Deltaproteobacteria bacterium]|nr:hypothetical protein [Deltaproteobacteria bacterium]
MLKKLNISLPLKILQKLTKAKINNLDDILSRRGLGNILDISKEESPVKAALERVDAHARLHVFSTDTELNDALIRKGYTDIGTIANMPRGEFVSAVADEVDEERAEEGWSGIIAGFSAANNIMTSLLTETANRFPGLYRRQHILPGPHGLFPCECRDCESSVSPLAYLADLLFYTTQKYVRYDNDKITLSQLEDRFHQPFSRLPISCEEMNRQVTQVRICIEVLRGYLQAHDSDYVNTPAYHEIEKRYLIATYEALLRNIGTSYEELRIARTQDVKKREALANRLGIPLSALLHLFLKPGETLTEENLEKLFGFPSTSRDPLATVEEPLLFTWRKINLKELWREQDFTEVWRGRPIIDPDLISPLDMRNPNVQNNEDRFDKVLSLWESRRNQIDGVYNAIRCLALTTGEPPLTEEKGEIRYTLRKVVSPSYSAILGGDAVTFRIIKEVGDGEESVEQVSAHSQRAFSKAMSETYLYTQEEIDIYMSLLGQLMDVEQLVLNFYEHDEAFQIDSGSEFDELFDTLQKITLALKENKPEYEENINTLKDLIKDLNKPEPSCNTIAECREGLKEAYTEKLQSLGLTPESHARLIELHEKDDLSAEEWEDVYNILSQAKKRVAFYPFWLEEEQTQAITLDTRYFWGSLSKPKEGMWPPDITDSVPMVSPELVKYEELVDELFGTRVRGLWRKRNDALKEYKARLKSDCQQNAGNLLRSVYGEEVFDFSSYKDSLDTSETKIALARLDLTGDDLLLLLKVLDPELVPSLESEAWDEVVSIVLKHARKKIRETGDPEYIGYWRIWNEAEQAESLAYWDVFKPKLPTWRATNEDRFFWQRALAKNSERPIIDPDLVYVDDINMPVFGFKANTIRSQRSQLIKTRHQNIKDNLTESSVEQIVGISDFNELETLYAQLNNGEDVIARIEQLHFTPSTLKRLLQLWSIKDSLLEDERDEVASILLQVEKLRELYPDWRVEEKDIEWVIDGEGKKLYLGPEYFKIPDILNNISELPKWRATWGDRFDWQDKLQSRIDQVSSLAAGVQKAVDDAEKETLVGLRDGLVALTEQTTEHTADWLADYLLIDCKTETCRLTTRVSQAILTIQRLLFGLSTRMFDDPDGNIKFSSYVENFDDEWKWLGSYATWRAAMFVWMYPENILVPGLLEKKSHAFIELEEGLEKIRDTEGSVSEAGNYEEYFKDILNLNIIGSIHQNDKFLVFGQADDHCYVTLINRGNISIEYWHPIEKLNRISSLIGIERIGYNIYGVFTEEDSDGRKKLNCFILYGIDNYKDESCYKIYTELSLSEGDFPSEIFAGKGKVVQRFVKSDNNSIKLCFYYNKNLYYLLLDFNKGCTLNPAEVISLPQAPLVIQFCDSISAKDENDEIVKVIVGQRYGRIVYRVLGGSFNDLHWRYADDASKVVSTDITISVSQNYLGAMPSPTDNGIIFLWAFTESGTANYLTASKVNIGIEGSLPHPDGTTERTDSIQISDYLMNIESLIIPNYAEAGLGWRERENNNTYSIEIIKSEKEDILEKKYLVKSISSIFINNNSELFAIENIEDTLWLAPRCLVVSEIAGSLGIGKPIKKLEYRKDKLINKISFLSNDVRDKLGLFYIWEAYYFLPVQIALKLQYKKFYKEALQWYRLVYDYTVDKEKRKIFYGLVQEEEKPVGFDRPNEWLLDPLDPHKIARTRQNTYTRFTIMSVARCLIEWGNEEFSRDDPESITKAEELYATALKLLEADELKQELDFCAEKIGDIDITLPNAEDMAYICFLKAEMSNISNAEKLNDTIEKVKGIFSVDHRPIEEKFENAHEVIRKAKEEESTPLTLGDVMDKGKAGVNNYVTDVLEAEPVRNAVAVARESGRGSSGRKRPQPVIPHEDVAPETPEIEHAGPEAIAPYVPSPYVNFSFCIPPNPMINVLELMAENNLHKIRTCRNIMGMKREVTLYAAPTDTTSGMPSIGAGGQLAIPALLTPPPTPYRFQTLLRRAKELADRTMQMEALMLAAIEKADEGAYRMMQARNDLQLARSGESLQQLYVKEAVDNVTLAELQKEKAQVAIDYYQAWLDAGLNQYEKGMIEEYYRASRAQQATAHFEAALQSAQAMTVANTADYSIAMAIANAAIVAGLSVARVGEVITTIEAETNVHILSLYATHERSSQQWEMQKSLSEKDIYIGDQQIKIANDHVDIANKQLDISRMKTDLAEDTIHFLDTKFTNVELYEWMSGVLEDLYSYFLYVATSVARLAERQLAFERQGQPPMLIQPDYWEPPSEGGGFASEEKAPQRRGLTGAERLVTDVTRLEQYKFETEKRKLQLTRTISLASNAPIEFQRFKQSGILDFATLLEDFEKEFPGHYLRLIKRIRVSVIALIPPTYGIRAELLNTGSSWVVIESNGIFQKILVRRDPEKIAFTSSQNATGLFELVPLTEQQEPDMLFPFEGLGVETQWELQMPKASNPFDFRTIADVLFSIDYTALDSWDYRQEVISRLGTKTSGVRPFSFRYQFPDQWYDLNNPENSSPPMSVKFRNHRTDYPPNLDNLKIEQIALYFPGIEDPEGPQVQPELKLKPQGTDMSIGGIAQTVKGIASTQGGSASSWFVLQGLNPAGEWEFTLPDDFQTRQLFKEGKITDILFVITYKGDIPAFPA